MRFLPLFTAFVLAVGCLSLPVAAFDVSRADATVVRAN
jgi:hypothetical protein